MDMVKECLDPAWQPGASWQSVVFSSKTGCSSVANDQKCPLGYADISPGTGLSSGHKLHAVHQALLQRQNLKGNTSVSQISLAW